MLRRRPLREGYSMGGWQDGQRSMRGRRLEMCRWVRDEVVAVAAEFEKVSSAGSEPTPSRCCKPLWGGEGAGGCGRGDCRGRRDRLLGGGSRVGGEPGSRTKIWGVEGCLETLARSRRKGREAAEEESLNASEMRESRRPPRSPPPSLPSVKRCVHKHTTRSSSQPEEPGKATELHTVHISYLL